MISGIAARNVLLVLVLVVSAGNLLASRLEVDHANAVQAREQAAQARQNRITEAKICHDGQARGTELGWACSAAISRRMLRASARRCSSQILFSLIGSP